MKKLKYKKKICIVSSSRADLGQLSGIIHKFQISKKFDTRLIISGLHLSNLTKFSFKETKDLNLKIKKKIYIKMKNFNNKDINIYFSSYIKKFTDYFTKNRPDLLIILGDRYETLAIVISAFFLNIPIAHLHGGEITIGSKDDSTRHAISKLSNYHFVANNLFKNRLIQMGENPRNIFTIGSPGLNNIEKLKFFPKYQLEKKLNIKFKEKNIIVTFHPEIDKEKTKILINQIFTVLKDLKNVNIFICSPNADSFSGIIRKRINTFLKQKSDSYFFENLGFVNYLSLSKNCNFVIGNSSSAIIEIPFLGIPSINVGLRQKGRPYVKSIFSTEYSLQKIKDAAQYLLYEKRSYTHQKLYYYKKNSNSNFFKLINKLNLNDKKYKKFFETKKKQSKYF